MFPIRLDAISVKCLATMKISVAGRLYVSTVVCLNIAHLASVKDRPAKCVNCSGDHPANSKECPHWEKEKKIINIKFEQNISFPEARKQNEHFYQARTYASAVKPVTCNKSTETDNKSTQMDDSFTEYLKQQTQEKQQEPPKGKPQEKGNQSSPKQTLKPATLEMMRKEGEKKKKEEKDKLKTQQKDERRQQYHKEKAQKDKEEAEKAIVAQKDPFSVFKKEDEEDYMEDDSVVFTDSSPSDHLAKGTLTRLPTT